MYLVIKLSFMATTVAAFSIDLVEILTRKINLKNKQAEEQSILAIQSQQRSRKCRLSGAILTIVYCDSIVIFEIITIYCILT